MKKTQKDFKLYEDAIILSIKEVEEKRTIHNENITIYGLLIETDKGDIRLMIDNKSYCCENSGYKFFETPDDISKVVGSKLLRIKKLTIPSKEEDGGETQLKITTSAGVIQYAVYNFHNGYYCHAVISQLLGEEEIIEI